MCWTSKVSNYHVILVEKENLICLSPGIWSVFHRQSTASLFDSTSSRFMSAWLNQCWSSGENHIPQLCRNKTHTHATYFKSLKLYIDIFIFLNEKEKTVGFEMLGRRTVPARLRGHDGIYSVKFPTHCSHQSTHTDAKTHIVFRFRPRTPPPSLVQSWTGSQHLGSRRESNCNISIKSSPTETCEIIRSCLAISDRWKRLEMAL